MQTKPSLRAPALAQGRAPKAAAIDALGINSDFAKEIKVNLVLVTVQHPRVYLYLYIYICLFAAGNTYKSIGKKTLQKIKKSVLLL